MSSIDLNDWKNTVGNAATFFTLGVFLSGIEICRKIWNKKSTCDISALPFVCGLVSCSLWLRYGLLINDAALIVVNGAGGSLQVMYLFWYARFVVNKTVFYRQLSTALCIIGGIYFSTMIATEGSAQTLSGFAACTAGVLFMGSPLAALAHVLKTRSCETLPFPMIICTFIMAVLWVLYGFLRSDLFVQIPNFLGAVLALSQLSLFLVYPSKKPHAEMTSM